MLPGDRKAAPVETYTPGQRVEDVKARFDKLNAFIISRGGWVVSIPGAPEVTIECLPDSSLPAELFAAGYDLSRDGEGQRILPAGIVEQLTRTSSGALVPITPGSTQPITETRTHAGIVRVMRFMFSISGAPARR